MSIVRHHAFAACAQLEHSVIQLSVSGNVTGAAKDEFLRWHSTVYFKLECADFYLEETTKHTNSLSSALADGMPPNTLHLNRVLDSFLSCLFSAQDVLARELNFLFGNPMAGIDRWYLTTLASTLTRLAGTRQAVASVSTILSAALDRSQTPLPPLLEIRDYRSVATHEMLIPTTEVTFLSGGSGTSSSAKLYLPDDAGSRRCTAVKELCPTCTTWFARQLDCFDQIYRALHQELHAHSTIPLP